MEDCFFFKNSTYNLFGCLHKPGQSEKQKEIGLVICSPFAEEKLRTHRVIVNFARYLADNGFTVLRFDYMGHGDSEGSFEDSDIETRLSDIKCAVEIIKEKSKIQKVGLLGLRLGATLAALCAEDKACPNFMVLWEPVFEAGKYFNQCLRSNLTTQMSTYKKIIYTREQMLQDMKSGKAVNIDGYLISSIFYQQALSVNLNKMLPKYSSPVLITHISKNSGGKAPNNLTNLYQKYFQTNPASSLAIVKEMPFWSNVNNYYQKTEKLYASTFSWLSLINNKLID